MASAGTVTVDFAAETAKFTAELKKVNSRLKNVEGGFKTLERTARTALGLFSVGAFAGFIRNAAEAADELGKTARQLRLSTEELKAFQHAAKESGVEVGASNRLLIEATKRLGEAAVGTGEAARYIKALGLDIGQLRNLRPNELFERYAEAIASLKGPGDQAAAAQKLMGQSALEAMPFILQSGEALEASREFVERYGLALGTIETTQIEAANDAIGRLGALSQAAGQQIAAGFSPYLEALATNMLEASGSTERMREIAGQFGATIQTAFALASNSANLLKAAFFGISGVIASMLAGLTEAIASFAEYVRDVTTKVLDFQLRIAESIPTAVGEAIEARVAAAQEPLRRLQENITEATGAVAAAFRASSDANYLKAEESLRRIQSIEQIQAGIIATLEESRARAEAAVAQQQTTGTRVLAEESPALTAQQNFEAIRLLAEAHADEQKELQKELTDSLRQELERRLQISQFYADQGRDREIAAQQAIIQARQDAFSAGVDALQAYAGRSKSAAKTLVAINRARAMASAIMNTYEGATLQLTTGDPYTATARAAAVVAFGFLQVAAIAKTAYGEIQAINANGGAPIGSPSNPVYTQPQRATSDGQEEESGQSVLAVHIHGNFFGSRETVDYLIEQFREEVNQRDVVLFSRESRQAQELVVP